MYGKCRKASQSSFDTPTRSLVSPTITADVFEILCLNIVLQLNDKKDNEDQMDDEKELVLLMYEVIHIGQSSRDKPRLVNLVKYIFYFY